MDNHWFEGDFETCDACVLCIHGQDSPHGYTRHERIAEAGDCALDDLRCDGCPHQGSTGQVMPDDDLARQWMDEQASYN